MKLECEHLFCFKPASARVSAPHYKARQFICEEHLQEVLKRAERYRKIPGAVVVEQPSN